jgi:hypothetical protein
MLIATLVLLLPAQPRPAAAEIKPAVPVVGRPDTFTGAVGPISLTASAEAREVRVGEALPFELTVALTEAPTPTKSAGGAAASLKDVRPPDLSRVRHWPAELSAGAPDGPAVDARDAGGRAVRRWRWTLRGTAAGAVRIPPIRLSSWRPDLRRFDTVSSAGIDVVVTPAETFTPPARASAASPGDRSGWRRWLPVALLLAGASVSIRLLLRRRVDRAAPEAVIRPPRPPSKRPRPRPDPRESSSCLPPGDAMPRSSWAASPGGNTKREASGITNGPAEPLAELARRLHLPPGATTIEEILVAAGLPMDHPLAAECLAWNSRRFAAGSVASAKPQAAESAPLDPSEPIDRLRRQLEERDRARVPANDGPR